MNKKKIRTNTEMIYGTYVTAVVPSEGSIRGVCTIYIVYNYACPQ